MYRETGQSLETRKKEHIKKVKNYAQGFNIANYSWKHLHVIDFENSRITDKGHYRIRKTLETWHTATTKNTENNARSLLSQYFVLMSNQRHN